MATYYVATTGDDNDPGTEAEPWATVNKAATTAVAGDTVIFEDGTWNLTAEENSWGSGTLGSHIIFKARNSRLAIWKQAANMGSVVECDTDSYVEFQGLKIEGDTTYTLNSHVRLVDSDHIWLDDVEITGGHKHGFRISGGCSDVTLRGCEIHTENSDEPYDGISVVGVGGAVTNLFIENCEVYNNWHANIDLNVGAGVVIRNCDVHHSDSHLISIGDSDATGQSLDDILIEGCTIHNEGQGGTPEGHGIRIHSGASNVVVRRNDVYETSRAGLMVIDSADGPVDVYNNTFYACNQEEGAAYGVIGTKVDEGGPPAIDFKNKRGAMI
jgi:nitrous oxidase accessory protein NosD